MIKIYVYKIENLITNKVYIGSSKYKEKRINGHFKKLSENKHVNDKLQEDYNLYGKNSFNSEIIYECFCNDKYDQLIVEESITIQYENLYNLRIGAKTTPELKNRISDGNTKYFEDPESRKKLSDIAKERLKNKENHPMYGKKHSEDSKQKMSEVQKGKQLSEETRKKMSESRKGENNPMYGKNSEDYMTEEAIKIKRQRMSEARKGKKHTKETKQKMSKSRKGREFSEDHRKKLSKALREPIDNEMIELILYFYYIKQFTCSKISRLTGMSRHKITKLIHEKQTQC